MSEQNNDNISQFFRKAVQKPKIRFAESDWEKLEARLDSVQPAGVPKPNHWKTAFIAAVALLFITTALLFYTNRQANIIARKSETNNASSDHPSTALALPKNERSSIHEQPVLRSSVSETHEGNSIHSSSLFHATRKEVKSPMMNGAADFTEEHAISSQSDVIIKDDTLFQNTTNSDITKGAVASQSLDKNVNSQTLPVDSCSIEEEKDLVQKSKLNLNDSLAELVKPKPSRWSVMLSLSPDFSSTDLDKFTTPGDAFGIAAYYAINHALSISAGVVKSNKLYWDSGDEYKPAEEGFWAKRTHGIVPAKIEGSCSVLEIPIGLQYYAVSTKKNKLYLASTFSSYIMLKESYQYTFDAPNPGAAQGWHAKKTSYSLFSIANLAVGYERSISDRLMIGVSPYIKIPMSGIGSWANVKLYSMGAAFTLRYQFQKKKKPDQLIPAD